MRRNFIFGGLTLLLLVVFVFGLLEISVRIVQYRGMNFDIEMWKYAKDIKQQSANYDIAHEHRPNSSAFLMGTQVDINSKKLRDQEHSYEKTPGTRRVLMLGDSLTFGWGVRFADTTSQLIEERLNRSGGPWEVINAGVGNYNTSQEVAYYLAEGQRYEPDVVVLNYFINDAEPTPRQRDNLFLRWSYAYVYLSGRFDILMRQLSERGDWRDYYHGLYAPDQPGWKVAAASIRTLAETVRSTGARLIIANYPELHDLRTYPFPEVSDSLARLAGEIGAEFIDLTDSVRGREETSLWVHPEDAHPNGLANRLFSDALVPLIEK